VWLLYPLVARYFGRVAGLAAALALAVSPVSVSVNRDNNPDALLALLLVASVYAGARAVESGRLRWLVGCAVLVGLAFNTKMLVAAIVVSGIALAYLLLPRLPWRVRAWHFAVACVVLVAVSGAWIAAVDLTPAADRPYVGSTTDNSALSLAFDYNGLGRVEGQTGGTSTGGGLGGAFSGTPGLFRLLNDALGD
jgi:4-amino-4-deoxy-L-arabinose transferase-like glycosyltransferase